MNNSAINKYLANTSNKNIHLENNKYTNQLVHLNANNNIPHGLVQLPRNIRAIHGPDSLMHGTVKISDALKIVHNKGGGVVFGMFCRGTRGTLKTGPGKKVLLNDGAYWGFWGDRSVSIPFVDEEIVFKVKDYLPGPVHKAWVVVKNNSAKVFSEEG